MLAMHAGHGYYFGGGIGVFAFAGSNHLVPEDIKPSPLLVRRAKGDVVLGLTG
jgi:hypothetical protein